MLEIKLAARTAPAMIALSLMASVLVGCGSEKDWNVVLVTFDTTRADHIGCYGHEGIRTPHIDALASDGVRFESAFTAVPITAPSHSTILTGKYPLAHGFRDNGLFVLGDRQQTLAEVLRDRGYATAAAIGSYPLLARFGLDQGFDLYDDQVATEFENLRGEAIRPRERIFFDERRAARVNEAVLPWLEEHHGKPFFLWAHYFDPHQPTEPPPPYDQLYMNDPYSGEIAYADEMFGKLIERLRELGVYERTIIVFASDHGEGLDEHGESTHSILLYNGTLRIPLIIRSPEGRRGAVVETRVGTVDILPTVLDLLGVDIPEEVQGRSLASAIVGDEVLDAVPLYAESLSPRLAHGWGELRALVDGDDKIIYGPRPELFDIEVDPHELDDLYTSEPELGSEMERKLAQFIRDHAVADLDAGIALDDEARDRLMALGYIHAGGDTSTIEEKLRREGEAPQDRVIDVSDFSEAKQAIMDGRYLWSRDLAEDLLERDPDNPTYLELLATSEIGLGRIEAADEVIQRLHGIAASADRLTDQLLVDVGLALFRQGEPERALDRLRQSIEIEPTARAYFLLASVLGALDRSDEEITALEQALELNPVYVPARIDLAIWQARNGERDAAEENFRRVLADEPYFPRGHFNYGAFLVEAGETDRALDYFLRATELQPSYWQAHLAVVAVHAGTDRLEEAREYASGLESRAPGQVRDQIRDLLGGNL